MGQTWLEVVIVAVVAAIVAVGSGLVVNLVSAQIKPVSGCFLVLGTVVVVLLTAAVAAYPQLRDRLFDHGAAKKPSGTTQKPSGLGPSPAPATRSSPVNSQSPLANKTSSPGKTVTRKPVPAKIDGYIASARSSTAGHADNHPPAKIRFWAYGGASVIGDVRFANGGYTGRYGWAPVAIGKDCSVPYVRFIFGGIATGSYEVSVHVPDVPGLAHQVEMGGQVVDQAAHRGEWLRLSTEAVTKDVDGGTSFELEMSQSASSFGEQPGCSAGTEHIAFDAVWLRPL